MLKKRKIRKSNVHIGFLSGLIILFFSCSQEKCIQKIKDERFLKEYFVEIDSCNTFQNISRRRYFNNYGLFMAGYGDRLSKQGEWSYFYKGEKVGSGLFKNGKPTGKWSYKYFKDFDWKVFKNNPNTFEISIPSSWYLEENLDHFSLFICANPEDCKEANLNIVVSEYDQDISKYVSDHTDSLELNGKISEIDIKELKINNIDEAFQRKFKVQDSLNELIVFQTFYGRKDLNKIFIITENSKYNLYKSYEPIFESILSSFKMHQ